MVASFSFYLKSKYWISTCNLMNPHRGLHTITNCGQPALRSTNDIYWVWHPNCHWPRNMLLLKNPQFLPDLFET